MSNLGALFSETEHAGHFIERFIGYERGVHVKEGGAKLRKLQVMDLTAVAMLEGKSVVIRVFDFDSPDSFLDVLEGKDIGTIISEN